MNPVKPAKLDKVTLQIFANHCAAAAESMSYTLMRTAHSTYVKETEDFASGLTTPDGKTFASSKQHGATWFTGLDYGPVIALINNYAQGDICITNDPYSGHVCTHTPDVHVWKPVFHEGEIVCFVVGMIHNTDMGGAVPSTVARVHTDVHQEGIRMPPVKLIERGKMNETVKRVLLTNVRVPDQNWGDLKAQIAALNTGERKVHELIARFGIDTFRRGAIELMDYAELQAREVVRKIPDGEYHFTEYMDEDSPNGFPCRLAVTIKVKGDGIVMDFTGTDPQLASAINLPTGGQERHALIMVGLVYTLYLIDKSILLNAGTVRVARAILPEGSVVNPHFPAAVGVRSMVSTRLQLLLFGAFSLALPDLMPGGQSGTVMSINVKTTNAKGAVVMASINPITGGSGAMPSADGVEGCGGATSFFKNTPIEITESEVPVKILRYGLSQDSGGPGYWRGGSATALEFMVFAPQTTINSRNFDGSRFQSWGVRGGRAGKLATFHLNPGTGREVNLGNSDIVRANPGDVIRIISSGAGGWGDPLERPEHLVLRDVECRFVSVDAARSDYGVVIADGKIDTEATKVLRGSMRKGVRAGNIDLGAAREAFEAIWTTERYEALTLILSRQPVNWRFFVKHRIFEEVGKRAATRSGSGLIEEIFAEIKGQYAALR